MQDPFSIEQTAGHRSPQDVLDDHLLKRQKAQIKDDIECNYAEDAILLTTNGIYRGHAGVRRSAQILFEQVQNPTFQYLTKVIAGDVAFLEWVAEGGGNQIQDGTDTFIIKDGRIIVQTIHYTVKPVTGVF
jgi:hypothetical protein